MAEQQSEHGEQAAQEAGESRENVRDMVGAVTSDGGGGAQDAIAANVSQLQGRAKDAAEQLRAVNPQDAKRLVQSVMDWTRKRPGYALGAALLLGFLCGRASGRSARHDD